MFVFSNFLMAAARILDIALSIYMWIIIIASLITWVNPDPYNPIVRFLYKATEPVLKPIRRRLNLGIGIDISPVIVILIIIFLQSFLIKTLVETARRLG